MISDISIFYMFIGNHIYDYQHQCCNIVLNISVCHVGDPDLIPGNNVFILLEFFIDFSICVGGLFLFIL